MVELSAIAVPPMSLLQIIPHETIKTHDKSSVEVYRRNKIQLDKLAISSDDDTVAIGLICVVIAIVGILIMMYRRKVNYALNWVSQTIP